MVAIPAQDVSPYVSKGLGKVEASLGLDISRCLLEQVDLGAVFSLRALDTDLVHPHPGTPDEPVCGPHQSDGDHTLDISARFGVSLLELCYRADGYPFQGSHRIFAITRIYHDKIYRLL